MRPHRLRVTAFGAFPDTVEVDFDALAASGLFLFHGETGAGKSTLLDALGFALYGRVPGARGQARRLRSDHAGAATRTEVELEVTLGGRRLRLVRSPEQERPKLRGSGMTTEPAKVLLQEWSGGGWATVSTRVGEADAEVADLLGMSAEQFFQVVMLPQGEFARFLRADSADRARLLERLFSTDRFRSVEQWLAERRRTSARAVEEARARIAAVAARVAQVADVPAPDADPEPGWAEALAESAGQEAELAAGRAAVRGRELDEALAAAAAAEQLADRQRRRADAQRRRAAVEQAAPSMARLAEELDAALRAGQVAGLITQRDQALERADALTAAEQDARAALVALRPAGSPPAAGGGSGLDPAHPSADAPADAPALEAADAPALDAALARRRQREGQLEALRALDERARTEEAAAADGRRRAERLGAELAAVATRLETTAEQRGARLAEREVATAAGQRLADLRLRAQAHRAAAGDARVLGETRADEQRLAEEQLRAREDAVALRERAHRLRAARFDGMIAELAAALEDGTPCPVCGALDHPDPSEVRGERVTREQEEQAAAKAQAAQERVEQVGNRLAAARARAEQLQARLDHAGLGADPAALFAAADALEAELAATEVAAGRLAEHEVALTELDAEHDDLTQRRVTLLEQQRAALAEAADADRRATQARVALAAELGDAPHLDAALAQLRHDVELLAHALSSVTKAEAARAEADRAAARAQQAAREAGFADADQAASAARRAEWRRQAQERLDRHREEAAATQSAVADPDLDVELEPPADVETARTRVVEARAASDAEVGARDRAAHRATQLAELAPRLARELAALAPMAERAEQIRRLADLAAGQGANTLRMTLSSFVLAARLEEVAAAASERLLRMTQGRYSLVHTDAGRGGGRAGLGLLARDTWTGHDRDTSTLSGGETFLASLALALGLADVVTAEAGGSRLEALFVDEGFGTLDEDTLDEVMDVLDALREGGRLVGLVSHVAELRQRIPAQVRVRKTRTGSDVETVVA